MRLEVIGPDYAALVDQLLAKAIAVDAATRVAVPAAVEVLKASLETTLTLTSHARGTATPSAPGQPPAKISGDLAKSPHSDGVRGGAGVYEALVGATTAYARIQELGGRTGRGHRTVLPARPYLHPALRRAQAEMRDVLVAAWRHAVGV